MPIDNTVVWFLYFSPKYEFKTQLPQTVNLINLNPSEPQLPYLLNKRY